MREVHPGGVRDAADHGCRSVVQKVAGIHGAATRCCVIEVAELRRGSLPDIVIILDKTNSNTSGGGRSHYHVTRCRRSVYLQWRWTGMTDSITRPSVSGHPVFTNGHP